ncbi:efflux RND transporter periplasmic adaptor subunit [Marinicella meishanensis]|uniref:efflux RND transporter periplasmic adaptor subunit n=1 Tax=Marinicella meishanensis TaxID=2873263 RepID=UPI001CC019EE|nr:efflux RND transporter periplasmic adaptor subunit [Marinicella sp. NBU2979]
MCSLSVHAQTNVETTIPVTTQPLGEVLIERRLTANAEVVAKNNSQLSTEITAVVQAVEVELGDAVTQGDLLVRLDATDVNLQWEQAKANIQAAQARLTQAELRLERANELKQSQYISADDLLARETDVAVLRADLLRLKVAEKSAARQVEKTRIHAPFNGVVTARQAQLGQLLVTGSPVLNLVQRDAAQVHAKIPSHTAAQLAAANRLEFVALDQTVPVELLQLSGVIEAQSALQTARFKPLAAVLVGQSGQLVWTVAGQMLPADLVIKRDGQLGFFTANGDRAQFNPLPEAQEGRPAVVNFTVNQPVIIGGRERLQDGQAIMIK